MKRRRFAAIAAGAAGVLLAAGAVWAQDTGTAGSGQGRQEMDTEVISEAGTEQDFDFAQEAERAVHVCVHDPAVFADQDGLFYLLGSHTASASSRDLIRWEQLNFDYGSGEGLPFYGNLKETFAGPFEWAGCDDGDSAGKMAVWAPDLIFDPYFRWEDGDTGAYLLYACTSSTWRRSALCFLAAKELKGPYTFGDTLVYSGFTKNGEPDGNSSRDTSWDREYLNLKELTDKGASGGGIDGISENWFNRDGSWNHTYAPNAIDPNVFFDASGERMYLSYGSWSGGIFLLELDRETGKAIYPGQDGTDEISGNFVDRYFGVHLMGGEHLSGEGPYISWDAQTEYYYLYCTYGGLAANGGYNMRLFRSRNVTGPYLDAAGNNAAENVRLKDGCGIKLIGNYAFYGQLGMRAAGHNSQLNAGDGSRYLIYHQRFDVKPQLEAHEVRVHQQFMNEDLWPVTAVYEYRGEQPGHYRMQEIAGPYEFICHGSGTDGDMLRTQMVALEEDGQVSGALEGSWAKRDSGSGYDYLTILADGVTYKGFFFRQHKEGPEEKAVMTFSAIGDDNTCIWGSAADEGEGELFVSMAETDLKQVIIDTVKGHGQLPARLDNCDIVWISSDESVVTGEGQVRRPSEKSRVELTAVITCGEARKEHTYKVTVRP